MAGPLIGQTGHAGVDGVIARRHRLIQVQPTILGRQQSIAEVVQKAYADQRTRFRNLGQLH